jgi:hypothetical protein
MREEIMGRHYFILVAARRGCFMLFSVMHVDRLFVPRKAIHETTRNNTNEVSSKFEFSHFDFLGKATRQGFRSQKPRSTPGYMLSPAPQAD